MESNRTTIVERIAKLQALANHPTTNVDEAANAAAQAAKLVLKYNIEDAVLEKAGKKAKAGYTHQPVSDISYKQYQQLLYYIARANFCEAISVGKQMEIVGQPDNIEMALYVYETTKRAINRMLCADWKTGQDAYRARGTTKANQWTAFWYGTLAGVHAKLKEQKAAAAAEPESRALVLVKDTDLVEAVHQIFPRLAKRQSSMRPVDTQAYSRGFQAGHDYSPNKPLKSGR